MRAFRCVGRQQASCRNQASGNESRLRMSKSSCGSTPRDTQQEAICDLQIKMQTLDYLQLWGRHFGKILRFNKCCQSGFFCLEKGKRPFSVTRLLSNCFSLLFPFLLTNRSDNNAIQMQKAMRQSTVKACAATGNRAPQSCCAAAATASLTTATTSAASCSPGMSAPQTPCNAACAAFTSCAEPSAHVAHGVAVECVQVPAAIRHSQDDQRRQQEAGTKDQHNRVVASLQQNMQERSTGSSTAAHAGRSPAAHCAS